MLMEHNKKKTATGHFNINDRTVIAYSLITLLLFVSETLANKLSAPRKPSGGLQIFMLLKDGNKISMHCSKSGTSNFIEIY